MISNFMNEFLSRIHSFALTVREKSPSKALILHHNDTDGLTAGSILQQSLSYIGAEVDTLCLEKTYSLAMSEVKEKSSNYEALFITDFSSGILSSFLSNFNKPEIFAVFDHHSIDEQLTDTQSLYNPMIYSSTTGRDCSASTICGYFADFLLPDASFLYPLAVLGAYGDGHFRQGSFSGLNAKFIEERITDDTHWIELSDRKINLLINNQYYSADKLRETIDVLGSLGYLCGGPESVLQFLQSKEDFYSLDKIGRQYTKELEDLSQKIFQNHILTTRDNLQYFILDEETDRYGVKTVGLLCEKLRDSTHSYPDRYIVGFQTVPRAIPRFQCELSGVKVSMRVPEQLWKQIELGIRPDLIRLMTAATSAVGGEIDACHPHAAATLIPKGSEDDFLDTLQTLLR